MTIQNLINELLNGYLESKYGEKYLKEKDENLTSDDTREGLVAVVSVKLREPQFEGQTKARLGNPEARTAVEMVANEALKEFLEKHPQEGRRMVEKVLLAAKARMAAKAAKDTVLRKGALEGLTLPGKLADCSSRNAAESEMFIVEGDSAGGCFSGDTKVALADGRNISFRELVDEYQVGKRNFCYTIGASGDIEITPIVDPRVTKRSAKVIKVVLDSGEEIICTPDHRFMLRDGSYHEARYLTPDDSLMPFYRKTSKIGGRITIDGYEMVFQPRSHYWQFTHMLSDVFNLARRAYKLEDGSHRHHRNFNKLNNNPDNIVRLTPNEHLDIHRRHISKTLHRADVIEMVRILHATPEFREKIRRAMLRPGMRKVLSDRAKRQWQNETYKQFMAQKFLEFYTGNPEYRRHNNKLLNEEQRKYWANEANVQKQAERVRNYFMQHKEKRDELSECARKQWENETLRAWRAETTKKQWTPEFRAKRKEAYNRTYLQKALDVLRRAYDQTGEVERDAYDRIRKETNDKSLLRYDTIANRFFGGNLSRLAEAVSRHNHKVKATTPLAERIDVYDLEVPGTHNFALASGVFVHNSAKMGRDRRTQAILPVKGKILNVEKARIDKMLANQEIRSVVIAMGTAISENFDITKLRYHKIIIMSDADVDGAHIRTLFLTLFYRYFPQIIENGHLYIAEPPLFRIQSGKEVRYAFNDAQKDKIVAEMAKMKTEKAKGKLRRSSDDAPEEVGVLTAGEDAGASGEGEKMSGVTIQRYKGLGEMNANQLWDTTMNPETRTMKQVAVEDAEKADRLFNILMGDQVEPRKQFIQAHAAAVRNLDV